MSSAITSNQMTMAGNAARRLLQTAWADERRVDITVITGIEAVAKTVSSDPVASVTLLRTAIEPMHLRKYGYRELFWLAHRLKEIAAHDLDFVVDFYQASYAWHETSTDTTQMGTSALLSLSSNKRQDYQGAWHQLEEFVSSLMEIDITATAQAVARAVEGYVRRAHPKPSEANAELQVTFSVNGTDTQVLRDSSLFWFRGGYVDRVDAPALMTRFAQELRKAVQERDGASKFATVVNTFRAETTAAGLWGIAFDIAAEHPHLAHLLAPLTTAEPILQSLDLLYSVGTYLTSGFRALSGADRSAIEQAILALTGPGIESTRSRLAGCIPLVAIETTPMREYRLTLDQSGGAPPNEPVFKLTSSFGSYDSDAHLTSQGVPLEAKDTVRVRKLVKEVEQFQRAVNTPGLSLADIQSRIAKLGSLHRALKRYRTAIPKAVLEHGEGVLADKSADLASFACDKIRAPQVHSALRRFLLACATSKNPPFHQQVEDRFGDNLSWGGPSARVSGALGLMLLARCQSAKNLAMFRAIKKLSRDKVAPVRYQISGHLGFIAKWDDRWIWKEISHVLSQETTRGVVLGAIHSLGSVARNDLNRTIQLAKSVLSRYAVDNEPGSAACRESAVALIFDIHIHEACPEATRFVEDLIRDLGSNAELVANLIARSSDRLLVDDDSRKRAIAFYGSVTNTAFSTIEDIARGRDLRGFESWAVEEQGAVRAMYDVLHQVSLRLFFASGADGDGSDPSSPHASRRARLCRETTEIFNRMTSAVVAPVAHHTIQALETFIAFDPPGVFAQIARSVRSSEIGGYGLEASAAKLIVGIVERYLADYRFVFVQPDRLNDLLGSLDVFVRAGWPDAHALTFRLGVIWR